MDDKNFKIEATPALNGLYHTYDRVAKNPHISTNVGVYSVPLRI